MSNYANTTRTVVQVVMLSVVWLLANKLSQQYLPSVPAGVLGMFLLLAALWFRWLPVTWCQDGVKWLLGEMILFFIPPVVAIVQYPDMIVTTGWKILLVILISTLLVMVVTSLVVDLCYRLETLLKHSKQEVRV